MTRMRTRLDHAQADGSSLQPVFGQVAGEFKALPCAVMLSGYPSVLYERELTGWRRVKFDATTHVGMATGGPLAHVSSIRPAKNQFIVRQHSDATCIGISHSPVYQLQKGFRLAGSLSLSLANLEEAALLEAASFSPSSSAYYSVSPTGRTLPFVPLSGALQTFLNTTHSAHNRNIVRVRTDNNTGR